MVDNKSQQDPISRLYNNIKNDYDLPDFNTFKADMSDSTKASKLHSALIKDGYEMPSFDVFSVDMGLKKKDGGIVSSPTKLPLQGFSEKQIGLLKKGVEKPISAPSQKKSSGLVLPTNLPKQEALAYENELKLNDAAANTLSDIYKKKGLKFDTSRPAAKKQIQEYVDKSINGDLTKVTGKDGKEYLVRSQGFFESAGDSFVRSLTDPIESTEINFTSNPEELANLLDEKIRKEPNIPEEAPSAVSGYLGGLAGGLPKLAAIAAIPYIGQTAMVGEMYYNALANQRRFLYERGLQEGMDRVSAAKKAMEVAPVSAIPDALVAAVMVKGVSGKSASNVIPNAAKESFIKAASNALKSVGLVSATGGFAGYERSKIQQRAGYNVTDAEAIENGFREAGDYAIMDAAFKVAHIGPKYLSSAAKNVLSNVPKEILNVVAEKYPDGKRTLDEIPKFVETKAKVQDFVPEEKLASVTGLTEKTDNIKSEIKDLEEKKKSVTPAIAKEIDLEIAEKNKEVDFYDNQIKKVIKSKDETGILEEVDDVTGLKAGEQITPEEVNITEDIEAKKADIEKRRKEELDEKVLGAGLGANRTLFNFKDNTIVSDSEIDLADKMIDNLISKSKNIESAIRKLAQLGYKFRRQTEDAFNKFVQDRIEAKTNKSFKEWREESGKIVNEINAKYDAELSALEGGKTEVKPTEIKVTEDIESKKASIEKERQADLDDLKKGIPAMITKKLESDLKQYGFTDAEINKMTPIVANETLIDAKYKAKLSSLEGVKPEVKVTEQVKPTEVKQPIKEEVKEIIEPIRQLGTGANVYFENNKYRVNDNSKGKFLLNIQGKEEGGIAIANIEFDSPKEAVEVAKELAKIYPSGVPDAVLIDKVVDDIRNKIKVKPTEIKTKEEKVFAQKDLDRAEAKKIHSRVAEMEPPSDAEQVALRYLAEGGKVSQDAINEVSGTTKRASLNTGRRELKTEEAKARDYAGGKESLDDLAHRLWEASGQEISERDIKNALMSEIGNNNSRLDASKAYLERYNIEYQEEQYYERFIEEREELHAKVQEELERDLRKPLEEETEGMSSEEHINNLIKQYEAETKRENKQLGPEGKGEAVEEISSRDTGKKAPEEAELAKEYKEVVSKASKKAKENAKKEFVDRNFDNLVKKLKIQIKCPT